MRSQTQQTSTDRLRIMRKNWRMQRMITPRLRKKQIKQPRAIFHLWTKCIKLHLRAVIHLPHRLHPVEVVEQEAVFQVQSEMWIMEVWQRAKPHLTRLVILQRNLPTCSRNSGSHSRMLGKKRARILLTQHKSLCLELQSSIRV